jgi:ATP-dependent HslUV protease, peptidase subunit HslV
MSTIVVVRKGPRAVIASDSLTTQGSIKISAAYKRNHSKIHRFQDSYVAFTGWSAFHNVFESIMDKYPGELDFRSRRHVFETFLKLHPRLKEHFFVETKEKDDQALESSQWDCLILSPGGVFDVSSNRTVSEYDRFWADGSGIRFALGAMHAVYDRYKDPESIARAGVEAACEFDDGSGGPIQLHSLELKLAPEATKPAKNARPPVRR